MRRFLGGAAGQCRNRARLTGPGCRASGDSAWPSRSIGAISGRRAWIAREGGNMKGMFRLGAAAALALLAATAAPAQRVGDWVLGQWRGGSDWYPGVVVAHAGNQVTIRYD